MKSVALKHEKSEDPTLIHTSHDEAENPSSSEYQSKIGRVLASHVPSQSSSLGNTHEFMCVGSK